LIFSSQYLFKAASADSERVCSTAHCASSRRFCLTAACAASGHVWSTAACGAPELYPIEACTSPRHICSTISCNVTGGSVIQQRVLHLDMSIYKSLCCTCNNPCTRVFSLHLDLSVYKSLCCTCMYLSVQHLNVCFRAAPGCACLQKPVLHLYVSVYHSWADPPKKYPRTPARRVAKLYKGDLIPSCTS
jgi:hypothetical protein